MAHPPPVVEISQVTFGYPQQPAPVLEGVDLTISADDFLGVIGPNGGGKTTLLKLMLGLFKPQAGCVRVFGKPPCQVRSRIGYVPQHAGFDVSVPASVLDVVLMGRLGAHSWGPWYRRGDVKLAMDALGQTQMDHLANRPIGALSGGQRQRVLIARALAGQAQLLLLDEPTAGVDAHMEHGLTDLLHQLNQRMPIVLVSHDVSFVSTHLKRVACLNKKMTCHDAHRLTPQLLEQMYHGPVRPVAHGSDCPLADPGCEQHCSPSGDSHSPIAQTDPAGTA